jgi:hypothetical protein
MFGAGEDLARRHKRSCKSRAVCRQSHTVCPKNRVVGRNAVAPPSVLPLSLRSAGYSAGEDI